MMKITKEELKKRLLDGGIERGAFEVVSLTDGKRYLAAEEEVENVDWLDLLNLDIEDEDELYEFCDHIEKDKTLWDRIESYQLDPDYVATRWMIEV